MHSSWSGSWGSSWGDSWGNIAEAAGGDGTATFESIGRRRALAETPEPAKEKPKKRERPTWTPRVRCIIDMPRLTLDLTARLPSISTGQTVSLPCVTLNLQPGLPEVACGSILDLPIITTTEFVKEEKRIRQVIDDDLLWLDLEMVTDTLNGFTFKNRTARRWVNGG